MIDACRSCGSRRLVDVLDLGDQYLSDFRADDEKPPMFPLVLVFCEDCLLVQLAHTTPRELMYHDRYGFKSGVNDTIRADLADVAREALTVVPDPARWLDIACNDGTLLSYVPASVRRHGIDPVAKLCHEAIRHAGHVVNDYFKPDYFTPRSYDVVTSVSVFYDLDDPNEFVAGVEQLLADGGVWVVQQNYLAATLRLNALDNVCHEHLTYWTLLALDRLLDRHGLMVFDVSESMVNGGSFRTLICRKGSRDATAAVREMRDRELNDGLYDARAYSGFGRWALDETLRLGRLVRHLAGSGKTVYIYGASTRGGTLWQAAGLTSTELPYAVDRNPEKVGKKIASLGTPIISEQQARDDHPDYMLVSPWFFRDEFVRREAAYLKRGGRFIFPLPHVEIL